MDKYNILLVSDNMQLRNEVIEALRNNSVTQVLTVEEAARTLPDRPIDIIVLDSDACEGELETSISQLSTRGTEPPIVALAPQDDIYMAASYISAGAFDYVLVPLDHEKLAATVNKAAEAQSLLKQVLFLKPQVIGMDDHPQPAAVLKDVAKSEAPVLIRGEPGSGVDIMARALHFNGSRRNGPFVSISCSTLPPNLLESELFGYEKGAAAGGMVHKAGQAELSEGGTLFIENIEALGMNAQMRLAKCIETRTLQPLGSDTSIPWRARIVAATETDLAERIRTRLFRDNLNEILSKNVIYLPPLRERREDIPKLINFYLEKYRRLHRRGPIIFSETILNRLAEYPWPGNLNELEKTIERYVLSGVMPSSEQPPSIDEVTGIAPTTKSGRPAPRIRPLKKAARAAERELIIETLHECGGNKRKAARALKISYKTLFNKLHEYNITTRVEFE